MRRAKVINLNLFSERFLALNIFGQVPSFTKYDSFPYHVTFMNSLRLKCAFVVVVYEHVF